MSALRENAQLLVSSSADAMHLRASSLTTRHRRLMMLAMMMPTTLPRRGRLFIRRSNGERQCVVVTRRDAQQLVRVELLRLERLPVDDAMRVRTVKLIVVGSRNRSEWIAVGSVV